MIEMKKAVTLIELIIVIVIIGALSVGFASYMSGTIDIWNFLSSRSEIVNEARAGLLRMAREIRRVENFTAASSSSLQFDDVAGTSQSFQYNAVNNTVDYGAFTLIGGVTSFTFSYLNNTDSIMPTPVTGSNLGNIHRVGVNVTLDSGRESLNLYCEVFPRSIRY